MNCNCEKCPYYDGGDAITQFQQGDTISVSFQLSEVVTGVTYYIGVYNASNGNQKMLLTLDLLIDLGENCFMLTIPHDIVATWLPRKYKVTIALKSHDGVVDTIDNFYFQINKSEIGKLI